MADYVSSALLAFQSKINKRYNQSELREQQNPILRTALANQDFTVADVAAIKESDKRAVRAYALKRISATNGTARSYNHTGSQGDSSQISLSWSTFSETTGVFLQTGYDNIFDTTTMLDNQIMQVQRILRERIGANILGQIHTNRSQNYVGTPRNATWNAGNFAFEIDDNDNKRFWYNAASIMRQQKYYDQFIAIADPITMKLADFLGAQGQGNATNLSYQFKDFLPNGIMEHALLGDTVASEYANGTALVMPQYAFSVIPWIPKINRTGAGDYEDFNGGWGTIPDATGLPITYAVHGWAQRADGSSNGSVAQDWKIELELSVDIAFQTDFHSTSGESAIFEFGLNNLP